MTQTYVTFMTKFFYAEILIINGHHNLTDNRLKMVAFLLLTIMSNLYNIHGLFTVSTPKEFYVAELGNSVTIECHFEPNGINISYIEGVLQRADPEYKASPNVTVLTHLLKEGKILFLMTKVQFSDAGKYHCIVIYKSAWDYKQITVKVVSGYKKINSKITSLLETDEIQLTCVGEGYPLANVIWKGLNVSVNTSHIETITGMFRIISTVQLRPICGNFTCEFWNTETNELTSHTFTFNNEKINLPETNLNSLQDILIPTIIFTFVFVCVMLFFKHQVC